ncbi:hypothetical protein KY284_011733 [Solanum tuberosum]|nr:hypothetical protein KY284_011733 [Solanum tuberosum]
MEDTGCEDNIAILTYKAYFLSWDFSNNWKNNFKHSGEKEKEHSVTLPTSLAVHSIPRESKTK